MWAQWKLSQMDTELRLLTVVKDWGLVHLDIFAIRTGVHASIANWYLARKVRQFNALREVDEFGDVVFLFGEAKRIEDDFDGGYTAHALGESIFT
jgi:hypothetical protein